MEDVKCTATAVLSLSKQMHKLAKATLVENEITSPRMGGFRIHPTENSPVAR